MSRRNLTILIIAICLSLMVNTAYGQVKFQNLIVEFGVSYNDSTRVLIDTTGVDKVLKSELKAIIPVKILIGNENKIFNELGLLGWELFEIEQNRNYLIPGHKKGTYYFMNHNGTSTKPTAKYYFKIRILKKGEAENQ